MRGTVIDTVTPAGCRRARWLAVILGVAIAVASCGKSSAPADTVDDLATSGYRSACTESVHDRSSGTSVVASTVPGTTRASSGLAAPAPPERQGIWPPVGDRLAPSVEVAANDFATRLLGNGQARLVVCQAGELTAVVRISPDGSGPAAELTLRQVGEQGWEVISSDLVGASLSLSWPSPTERNQLELRGAGRLAGWTVEALDPADARVLATVTASAGATAVTWQADLALAADHPARVLFLVYRSSDRVSGAGRRAPAGLAVAYPVS